MDKRSSAKKGRIVKPSVIPTKKPDSPKKKNNFVLFCIVIFTFSFILYGQSINYGYVLDDDLIYVYNKAVQQGIAGIPEIFTKTNCPLYMMQGSYRPLPMAHLAVEEQFSALTPSVNHFFNVFYYGLLGIILFALLSRLLKNTHRSIPLLITLIFLAHPVHSEVVANIKSRDEIFCFAFLLLSLLLLFKYIEKGKIAALATSVLCFFLGLLSKESGLTFLAIIPLALFYFSNEKIKRISFLTIRSNCSSFFSYKNCGKPRHCFE